MMIHGTTTSERRRNHTDEDDSTMKRLILDGGASETEAKAGDDSIGEQPASAPKNANRERGPLRRFIVILFLMALAIPGAVDASF